MKPTPVENPRIASLSPSCMDWIGLNNVQKSDKEMAEMLCGNRLFEGSEPIAHCYCGH